MSDIVEFLKNLKTGPKGSNFISYESLLQAALSGEEDYESLDELTKKRNAVRQETAQIVEQAGQEKDRIEKEAFQKGFDEGHKQGQEKGLQEFEAQIDQATNIVSELGKERDRIRRLYEQELLTLTKVLVERLVHHEVSINPLVIQASLQKALEYVVENSRVKVHLHRQDFEYLKQAALKNPSLLADNTQVELVEDSAITQGGCLLETDFGEIDMTFESCRETLFSVVDEAVKHALQENNSPVETDPDES